MTDNQKTGVENDGLENDGLEFDGLEFAVPENDGFHQHGGHITLPRIYSANRLIIAVD